MPDGVPRTMRHDASAFDIEAELRYWQANLALLGGAMGEKPPAHLIDSLKFAYDGFLVHGKYAVSQVSSFLRARHARTRALSGVDWPEVEAICVAVWQRMRG